MVKGRVSLAGIMALLLFSCCTFGQVTISGAGATLYRPDGTIGHNVGTLIISGNTVNINDLDRYGASVALATTFFRDGLEGKSIEEQLRAAISAILAYQGPTRRELQEAAQQCESGVRGFTPLWSDLAVSIIAGESRTTTIRDPSGAVSNVSTEETPATLVRAIAIQYGINCWCYDGPCYCTKFLSIRVTIMTGQGPCVFERFMRIGPPIPCS